MKPVVSEEISVKDQIATGLKVGGYCGFVLLSAWALLSLPEFPIRPVKRSPTAGASAFEGDQTKKLLVAGVDYQAGSLIVQLEPTAAQDITQLMQDLERGRKTSSVKTPLEGISKEHKLALVEKLLGRLPDSQEIARKFPARQSRAEAARTAPSFDNIFLLSFPPETDIPALAKEYAQLSGVIFAEPNFLDSLSSLPETPQDIIPNDPYYSSTGLILPNLRDMWGLQRIQAPGAWQTTTGSSTVVVAVSDSGIDYNHPDIQGRLWINDGEDLDHNGIYEPSDDDGIDNDRNGYVDDVRGWNFANGNKDTNDRYGHGTHVAGTIGATTNNATGVAGVSWQTKLMAAKGFDGPFGSEGAVVGTIMYATNNGADIINMSWAGYPSTLITNAITYAHAHGVVLVAAAGNWNSDVIGFTPAKLPPVVAVGAWQHQNVRASFSNWGDKLDLVAPGEFVLSLRAANTTLARSPRNDEYGYLSGTSMAAPHVSGVAALTLGVAPTLSVNMVTETLRQTAEDLYTTGRDVYSGYGMVQAASAVAFAQELANRPPATDLFFMKGAATYGTNFRDVRIAGEIENGGLTPAPVQYRIYAGDPQTGSVVYESTSPDLAPGATLVIDQTLPFPGRLTPFTLVLDPENTVAEYFESNNQLSLIATLPTIGGWPAGRGAPVISTPTLADLDRDGNLDVIVGTDYNQVYAWRANGTSLPGWPRPTGGAVRASPIVRDINGDGSPEVIVAAWGSMIYVWQANGVSLPGWPKAGAAGFASPTVTDINEDGNPDILIAMSDKIYAWHADGTLVTGWPQVMNGYVRTAPAVGDVDGDGHVEVVINNGNRGVYVWRANGVLLPGWPKTGREIDEYSTPALADLNRDGTLDIVVGTGQEVSAWSGDGTALSGWPQPVAASNSRGPAIGDIDGDGGDEVVAGSGSMIYAWNADGSPVPGWPKNVIGVTYSSPALADITGDGRPDILASSLGKLFAWEGNGSPISGWPQTTTNLIESSPVVADLNQDGHLEVVIGSWDQKVYVWTLLANANDRRPWPMYHHDEERTGVFHGPACNPSACPDLTGDGFVDASDVSSFAAAKATNDLTADFNGDGRVDIYDQNILASLLGSTNYSCTNRCSASSPPSTAPTGGGGSTGSLSE